MQPGFTVFSSNFLLSIFQKMVRKSYTKIVEILIFSFILPFFINKVQYVLENIISFLITQNFR